MVPGQWAMRDRVSTGLRLQPGRIYPTASPSTGFVTDLQYMQQPDDYHVASTSISATPTGTTPPYPQPSVIISPLPASGVTVDLYGGFGASNPSLWPVQPGDYLEVQGGGLLHQILPFGSIAAPGGGVIVDPTVSPAPTAATVLVLASSPNLT